MSARPGRAAAALLDTRVPCLNARSPRAHAAPRRHGKDAARALRRRIANGTPKAQLLALTVR